MQRISWTSGTEKPGRAARVLLGLALFVLLAGLWACLWVPPALVFSR